MAYKYLIKTWKESLITIYIFSERAAVQFIKIKGLWSVITVSVGAVKAGLKIAPSNLNSTFQPRSFTKLIGSKIDYFKVNSIFLNSIMQRLHCG
jgi:hypothetical protein